MSVETHINFGAVTRMADDLDGLRLELQDFREGIDAARQAFYDAVEARFEGDNDWAPLSDITVMKKGSARILDDSGALEESWLGGNGRLLRRGGNWITLGSSLGYAGFQEEGFENFGVVPVRGDIKRPIPMRGAFVPARPVLGDDIDEAMTAAFIDAVLARIDTSP